MWGTVDSLTPILMWTYPDLSCSPAQYRVVLSQGPLFVDEFGATTGSPSTSWAPDVSLEPGTEYGWSVEAVTGTTFGPVAGISYFFTGPSCDPTSLAAPDLLVPEDDAIITDPNGVSLIWDYPDPCLPQGYAVNLSTNLDFDGSPLNGGTGTPSTRWGPGVPLTDCTRYYWRVAAGAGSKFGDYSEVNTFRVAMSPSCPPEE